MNLGERLYELRKSLGLSQEEVADRLSVSRQTVSKWETGQSTPDFDKVVPLCELYHISTEELFTGHKPISPEHPASDALPDDVSVRYQKYRVRRAWVVSAAILAYILAVVVLMVGIAALHLDPIVISGVFLLICGVATSAIVLNFMTRPRIETPTKREKTLLKQINSIIGIFILVIYFLISFLTMAWHITWIIWVIYGLICQIVKLILMLREGEKDEKE